MPYDVFISYASSDRALAEEVNSRLVAEGFKVWFDKDRLEPGFDWHQLIEQGCENNTRFVLEMNQGWFARNGATIGATMTINSQTPKVIFFGK